MNKILKQNGFSGLDDPAALFAQMATVYNTHELFRGMLMRTKPDMRKIAYESIRPHLPFVAKPLDVYEREIKERAEREQWDVWNGTAYPEKFKVGEVESEEYRLERQAQEAIEDAKHEKAGGTLEMVCTRCTVAAYFPAPKRKQAVKAAHDAGWRWDERNGSKRQFCPDHVPGRLSMTLLCVVCGSDRRYRAWDEQDGYELARLAGWVITDRCVCASCATPREKLQ